MVNDHCCVRLYNRDKRYDSGKDPSYFNFPRDKQKRKRALSLEYIIYLDYIVYARPALFQIQNGGLPDMVGMARRYFARLTITKYEQ